MGKNNLTPAVGALSTKTQRTQSKLIAEEALFFISLCPSLRPLRPCVKIGSVFIFPPTKVSV